ncbi:hypothetical protein GCM10012320_29420 [Sinomonas cellulolyticus]|uniref:PKD domain-containing protein n=1 Tax=Sinomonas cellulolyticus TaxID=2801916 RepID=A0ABS1JXW4_9MICC|nr:MULTISPECIES: hypothetical protein [Sinomonas]MBL0704050.1 hypothetical protein [Sinomonas cellulolyticus]GHG56771.1 hypothetical protein GCM10012320_29420 [Sinomonas sp. KCTC 49339]
MSMQMPKPVRSIRKAAVALASVALCAAFGVAVAPAASAANPAPPFGQCPSIGASPSCAILIVINPDGSPTVLTDPSVGPYDSIEDTLIGVQNNSGQTITAMPISGTGIPFGFDGDGICTYANSNCAGNTQDSTGYGGPRTYFTDYSSPNSGTVNFNVGGLADGTSTYFSLEGAVNASSLVIDSLIKATPVAVNAVEGAPFSGTVATVKDADTTSTPGEYTATIDWGDSTTSSGTLSGTSGNFTVSGTHTYTEEGSYTATVTVTDADNASNTATVQSAVTISDAALSAAGLTFNSTNPVSHTLATFTDADPNGAVADYTATVSWGDGTSSAGTIGTSGSQFTVSGTHTYAAFGPYTVAVHVCDVGGSCADATTQVLTFGYATGGSFAIGTAANTAGTVNWWGPQWAQNNLATAPSAFKGFETSAAPPTCGSTWTTTGGASSNPPASVPTYMAVVVTDSVTQSGSTITGNVGKVVIVKTDPGYAPGVGNAGTGTVVGTICG